MTADSVFLFFVFCFVLWAFVGVVYIGYREDKLESADVKQA